MCRDRVSCLLCLNMRLCRLHLKHFCLWQVWPSLRLSHQGGRDLGPTSFFPPCFYAAFHTFHSPLLGKFENTRTSKFKVLCLKSAAVFTQSSQLLQIHSQRLFPPQPTPPFSHIYNVLQKHLCCCVTDTNFCVFYLDFMLKSDRKPSIIINVYYLI